MKKIFEDFIFPDRLRDELDTLITYPEIIQQTPILGFYGYAGVGKTSFANRLIDYFCATKQSFPLNERPLMNTFIDKEFRPILRTWSVIPQGDKLFAKGIILDEFHDLSHKDQSKFKVALDDVVNGGMNVLVIICLNTTDKNPLIKSLTEPILSRMYPINFDPRNKEENEMLGKVIQKFPLLSKKQVAIWLPDMRTIHRQGKRSEILSASTGGSA